MAKKQNNPQTKSTQKYLPIAEIKDGVVILRDGSLKMVLRVSGINFDLKSEAEQGAIEAAYQSFLNSLDFPIQIVVQSRKLRLDSHVKKLESVLQKQTNELLQMQTQSYVEYVKSLLEYANIMRKDFFIIITFAPSVVQKGGLFSIFGKKEAPAQTEQAFQKNKLILIQRTESVVSALSGCGVRAISLNTKELIELFYNLYNPQIAEYEKLTGEIA